MSKPVIRYDATNMSHDAVSRYGTTSEELKALSNELLKAKKTLLKSWKSGEQGWMGLPDDVQTLADAEKIARDSRRFTTCLVLGIGGSDLGTRAAWQALCQPGKGMELVFAGGNTDPDELSDVLARIDLKKTLVNIISKSGDTVEPMSAFLIVRDQLIKRVSKRFADHIVATTDERKGSLHDLAMKEGYRMLVVPNNVGGRFSVLSAVGIFPLVCAGIDVRKMLAGAKQVRDQFVKQPPALNAASMYAAMHVLGDKKRGQHIHVLMPYSARLKAFASWYRQIWAESLGKKYNREQDVIYSGPTPVAALGATDQHSQIQLYTEGPNDKIISFIEIASFKNDLTVPTSASQVPSMAYLSGTKLSKILHAERKATAESLRQSKRPNGTLLIRDVSAESLGGLFQFFEIVTGVAGELYGINTYDQPGVEAGKVAMYALLGRNGFETERTALVQNTLKPRIF